PAWSTRYFFTQFPRVPSCTPVSRATSAIGREVSTTIFAASSLNSGVYFLRRSGIHPPPFRDGPYWVRYPECGRRAIDSGAVPGAQDRSGEQGVAQREVGGLDFPAFVVEPD